ncbi:MAG: DUF5702 domain-containing protein [Lachnospiraceae bacterium]|nr:DUF5702 domain-containing protein [Lachnospiraceae bacterium]
MTMTLAILISLCLTMIEGARRSAMRMEAELITDTAMRSVFAEYNRELMRQYNIFAIDSSYGSSYSGAEMASAHFREYMEKNYTSEVQMPWLDHRDLIGAYPESAGIERVTYLTDDAGRVFRRCAIDAIRDDYGITAAEEVLGWISSSELIASDSRNILEEMNEEASSVSGEALSERERRESERSEQEAAYEQACAEAEENGEQLPDKPELTELPEEYRSPVSGVAENVNTGILGLLVDDPENLSRRQLNLSGIISGRIASGNVNEGSLEYMDEESGMADEMLEKALFGEYLIRYMGRYGDVDESDALWYQIEYLIAGESTDVGNLNSIALRIMGIRAGMDIIYLESDQGKKAEAQVLATAICTACMIEWMIPVLTHVILLAWALIEARYDTASLLAGKKIPFMKDSSTWHCDLDSALSGSWSGKDTDSDSGLSYKDYLRIFLFMTDMGELTLRAMDIVESDIRLSGGNSGFRMDSCIEMAEFGAVITSPFGSRVRITRRFRY